jgi:hypothetical protein
MCKQRSVRPLKSEFYANNEKDLHLKKHPYFVYEYYLTVTFGFIDVGMCAGSTAICRATLGGLQPLCFRRSAELRLGGCKRLLGGCNRLLGGCKRLLGGCNRLLGGCNGLLGGCNRLFSRQLKLYDILLYTVLRSCTLYSYTHHRRCIILSIV